MARHGAGLFSVGTLLASFFGAAMIAAAFAYFNYKFSEYKFINFSEWVFYEEKTIFTNFLCVSNRRKNEKGAPVGIRTRVEASKGPHDWPLHHRSTGSV